MFYAWINHFCFYTPLYMQYIGIVTVVNRLMKLVICIVSLPSCVCIESFFDVEGAVYVAESCYTLI